jgi:hypothetical protein
MVKPAVCWALMGIPLSAIPSLAATSKDSAPGPAIWPGIQRKATVADVAACKTVWLCGD